MISTKISPPSYSLGKRYTGSELKQQEAFKNVGPGSYELNLKNKASGPKYSLGGRGHSQIQLQTPAPGSYNIPQKVIEHVGLSMGQKYGQAASQIAPGPGSYSPDQIKLKSPNIRYSMGAKLRNYELEAKQKLPGPGNYDHTRNSSVLLKSPNTKFGSAQRDAQENIDKRAKANPGPGAYSVGSFAQVLRDKSPQYRFGSAPKNQVAKSMSPGPGEYQYKTIMGKDGPAVGMHARGGSTSNLLQASRNPGPGTYSPETRSVLKKAAAYQMGIKLNDVTVKKMKEFTTGPGQYDPVDPRLKGKGQYKFGSEARMNPLYKDGAHPAPGAYQHKGIIGNEGPKHSMHGRQTSVDLHQGKPGPGHYNHDKSKTMNKSPSYGMGVKLQNSRSQSSLQPGPGQYNTIDGTLNGPTTKIGQDKRFPDRQGGSVGPGQYQIGGIMGKDGPRQSMGIRLSNNSKLNHDKLVPGPGAYQNEKSRVQTSAPAYGMGSSPQRPNLSASGSPDPAKYNPNDNLVRNRSPGGKMGKDRRRPTYDDRQLGPGPGTYQQNPSAFTGKGGVRFGSAEKFKADEETRLRQAVPGPGSYANNSIVVKNKQPQYSMGGRPKSEISPSKTPGPAQYNQNASSSVLQKAPAYGVGKSSRFQDYAKNASPGPGSYKIPVAVAHLHQYTSTTNPDYKFV